MTNECETKAFLSGLRARTEKEVSGAYRSCGITACKLFYRTGARKSTLARSSRYGPALRRLAGRIARWSGRSSETPQ